MKKRSIALIIGLMSFALLGVIGVQLYFLRQSYQMQSEHFDNSVHEALDNVVSRVSKHDALNFLNVKAQRAGNSSPVWKPGVGHVRNSSNGIVINPVSTDGPRIGRKFTNREKKIALLRDSLKRMILHKKVDEEVSKLLQGGSINLKLRYEEFTDEYGIVHGRVTPLIVRGPAPAVTRHQKLHKYDTIRYTYSDPQFGQQVISVPQINPQWQQEQDRKQKERRLSEVKKMLEDDSLQNEHPGKSTVIANLAEEYGRYGEPLRMRLDPLWIDTLLRLELRNKGIDLPFSYEITTSNSDSLIFSKENDVSGARPVFTDVNYYQTQIFGKDVINDL